jgi:hypothetical protein
MGSRFRGNDECFGNKRSHFARNLVIKSRASYHSENLITAPPVPPRS